MVNHIHWTACTAKDDPSLALYIAIWKSGINHIRNIHHHQDDIYPECQHAPLPQDKDTAWLRPGTGTIIQQLVNKYRYYDYVFISEYLYLK